METVSTSKGNSGEVATIGHHKQMQSRVMKLKSSCRKFAGHAGFFAHPASGGVQDPCRNLPTITGIMLRMEDTSVHRVLQCRPELGQGNAANNAGNVKTTCEPHMFQKVQSSRLSLCSPPFRALC